ncbi:MAG: hypothetical protein ACRC3B_12105 [Bacteroidia bacterium]
MARFFKTINSFWRISIVLLLIISSAGCSTDSRRKIQDIAPGTAVKSTIWCSYYNQTLIEEIDLETGKVIRSLTLPLQTTGTLIFNIFCSSEYLIIHGLKSQGDFCYVYNLSDLTLFCDQTTIYKLFNIDKTQVASFRVLKDGNIENTVYRDYYCVLTDSRNNKFYYDPYRNKAIIPDRDEPMPDASGMSTEAWTDSVMAWSKRNEIKSRKRNVPNLRRKYAALFETNPNGSNNSQLFFNSFVIQEDSTFLIFYYTESMLSDATEYIACLNKEGSAEWKISLDKLLDQSSGTSPLSASSFASITRSSTEKSRCVNERFWFIHEYKTRYKSMGGKYYDEDQIRIVGINRLTGKIEGALSTYPGSDTEKSLN